jgi:hypothetical protein
MEANPFPIIKVPLHREFAGLYFSAAPILAALLFVAVLPGIGILRTLTDFNRMMGQIRCCVAQ